MAPPRAVPGRSLRGRHGHPGGGGVRARPARRRPDARGGHAARARRRRLRAPRRRRLRVVARRPGRRAAPSPARADGAGARGPARLRATGLCVGPRDLALQRAGAPRRAPAVRRGVRRLDGPDRPHRIPLQPRLPRHAGTPRIRAPRSERLGRVRTPRALLRARARRPRLHDESPVPRGLRAPPRTLRGTGARVRVLCRRDLIRRLRRAAGRGLRRRPRVLPPGRRARRLVPHLRPLQPVGARREPRGLRPRRDPAGRRGRRARRGRARRGDRPPRRGPRRHQGKLGRLRPGGGERLLRRGAQVAGGGRGLTYTASQPTSHSSRRRASFSPKAGSVASPSGILRTLVPSSRRVTSNQSAPEGSAGSYWMTEAVARAPTGAGRPPMLTSGLTTTSSRRSRNLSTNRAPSGTSMPPRFFGLSVFSTAISVERASMLTAAASVSSTRNSVRTCCARSANSSFSRFPRRPHAGWRAARSSARSATFFAQSPKAGRPGSRTLPPCGASIIYLDYESRSQGVKRVGPAGLAGRRDAPGPRRRRPFPPCTPLTPLAGTAATGFARRAARERGGRNGDLPSLRARHKLRGEASAPRRDREPGRSPRSRERQHARGKLRARLEMESPRAPRARPSEASGE